MVVRYDQQLIIRLAYNNTGTAGRFFLCILLAEDISCLSKVIHNRYHGRHDLLHHIRYIRLYISNVGRKLWCTLAALCCSFGSNLTHHCGIRTGLKHPGALLYRIEPDTGKQSEEKSQADTYHSFPEIASMLFGVLRFCIAAGASAHLVCGVTVCTSRSAYTAECTGCIFIAGFVTGKIIILVHNASSYPICK